MASKQARPTNVDKDYPNVEDITRSRSGTPINLDKAGIEEGKIVGSGPDRIFLHHT